MKQLDPIRKYLYYLAGFLFLGIGIAGYYLPILPGTVFLIISASCFIRSSDRMYKWVTEHKLFGSLVKDYLETGAIPQKIKYIAISCIWIASFISTVSIYLSKYDYFYILLIILISLASIGTWFIASRPTKF
tara:strand:- start:123 stop:518 length:396 start_codon:yes stop_codon:yes gene_type:complete